MTSRAASAQGLATQCVKHLYVFAGRDQTVHPNSKGARKREQPSLVLSMWQVVRTIEKMFPGESAVVRTDLLVLIIMNGNDYLPKVRAPCRCSRSALSLQNRSVHPSSTF